MAAGLKPWHRPDGVVCLFIDFAHVCITSSITLYLPFCHDPLHQGGVRQGLLAAIQASSRGCSRGSDGSSAATAPA